MTPTPSPAAPEDFVSYKLPCGHTLKEHTMMQEAKSSAELEDAKIDKTICELIDLAKEREDFAPVNDRPVVEKTPEQKAALAELFGVPSTSALLSVAEKIECLCPDLGFWQKGRPLDFTLEDVMKSLEVAAERRGIETAIDSRGSWLNWDNGEWLHTDLDNENGSWWKIGEPLSKQSEATLRHLDSLLPDLDRTTPKSDA